VSRIFPSHAFGARYDLPIPLLLFIVGGVAVVLLRVRAVGADDANTRFPDRVPDAATNGPVAVASLGALLLLALCGLLGSNTVAENILPTAFWLIVWIVIPLSCGLLGDWTRPVNPYANAD